MADAGPPVPSDHARKLTWFAEHAGESVSYSTLMEEHLTTRAKGIYKPAGSTYALSIREVPGSQYAHREVERASDGSWVLHYPQEGDASLVNRDSLYTNRSLVACMNDRVPVGVLKHLSPKPNTQYLVLGIAYVTDWQDGVFTLTSTRPLEAPILSPATTSSGFGARPEGAHYWAFLATPQDLRH